MNIVYTFDSAFVPQTAVSIASLCGSNTEAEEIRFFLLVKDVPEETRQALDRMIRGFADERHGRSAVFVSLGSTDDFFDFPVNTAGWKPIVLARLVLDRLLPESAGRVLYLDGDTLVRGSLKELWQTDLQGQTLGAAVEPTCSRKRKNALGLEGAPYYNAGVLLIDLDAWRANKTGEEILAFYREKGGYLFANDQDAINASQKGRIATVSPAYNYHNTYDLYRYRLLEKNCDYPVPSKEEIERIRQNPCIVHFLGEERPWREGNTNRFRREYEETLAKTPFAGQGMESGWKNYFRCWRIFNTVMRPFPMLRLGIINSLVPYMVRKKHRRNLEKK